MKRILNETEVKDILRYREQKIESIHKKMFSLHQEMKDSEEVLSTIALPAVKLREMPGGTGEHKDIGDLLVQYNRQLYQRNEELRKIMWELVEEEEAIGRLWACFHALGEPYYSILQALYVENQLYQAVESDFEGSHKTFEKYRQRGIKLLIGYYESGESIAEIMRRNSQEGRHRRMRMKKQGHNVSGQLDLANILDKNTRVQ